jgi:hypothetical protein
MGRWTLVSSPREDLRCQGCIQGGTRSRPAPTGSSILMIFRATTSAGTGRPAKCQPRHRTDRHGVLITTSQSLDFSNVDPQGHLRKGRQLAEVGLLASIVHLMSPGTCIGWAVARGFHCVPSLLYSVGKHTLLTLRSNALPSTEHRYASLDGVSICGWLANPITQRLSPHARSHRL